MHKNPLGIKKFGTAVIYVEDAEQEMQRLGEMLNMNVAYIPASNQAIYGIQSGEALFFLDSSPEAKAEAANTGNFVKEVGLFVENLETSVNELSKHENCNYSICEQTGAALVKVPHDGDLFIRLIEDQTKLYHGVKTHDYQTSSLAFQRIDHVVTNTQKIAPVIDFFKEIFGMEKVNEFTIKVETETFQASLYSEVMGLYGTEGEILFPINEPLPGDEESQIPAQLKEVGRSHFQHIALATDDIISSIKVLREKGLGFLEFRNQEHAKRYYEEVPSRLGDISVQEAMQTLRELGILVDKCGEGYLLQLFSKRLFPENSVPFVEVIQRASDVVGCFGDGNFAALAESLEWSMRQAQK